MPVEEGDEGFLEEEEEDRKKVEEKKSFLDKWVKILPYVGIFLGVVLISVVSAMLVFNFKEASQRVIPTREVIKQISIPKAVYIIPEFKLALDKKHDENVTTIVQVKIALAYPDSDQRTLDEIIKRKEQIRDKVQYVIARKSYTDISTARVREDILKKDLLYSLNNIMHNEILDIYFDTFVISRVNG